MRVLCRWLVILGLVPVSGVLAQPCTTSWAAPQSGAWSDDANWTNGAPGASDTACITETGTYAVTLDRDQDLATLVVGGATGTQTLLLNRTLTSLGEGTIGANGVVQVNTCAGCGGLPEVTGTLTVEGTLVHTTGASLLRDGGTVDIAPGGTLRVRTGLNTVAIGSLTPGNRSRVIVRGTLVFDAEGQIPRLATLSGIFDLDGGTVVVPAGEARVQGSGRWTGGTFDVSDGGTLRFFPSPGDLSDAYEVSGVLSGTPTGLVGFESSALAAAPGGVTLDVGGQGLQMFAGSGALVRWRSTGGEITNTGRLTILGNGVAMEQVVVRNEGVFETSVPTRLNRGAVFRNTPSGTVNLIGGSADVVTDGSGRFVNEGILVASGIGRSSFMGTLRSRAGSEIRTEAGAEIQLDPPGSASVPAGTRLTGNGTVRLVQTQQQGDLFIGGTVSPGTETQPIDTLRTRDWLLFNPTSGTARLVVDVGVGGTSDLVLHTRSVGPVPGSVRLAGALIVRVAEGYTPQVGDTFTILRTTNTTGDIEGDFAQVVAVGAPDGIAFVTERNADNSEVRIRAVETEPSGSFHVSAEAIVGGGERTVFLSGPGAVGVTGARIVCSACLDPNAPGGPQATLAGAGSLREVRLDLTSPRTFGVYDLVLERGTRPDTTVALTVRPFLSYISFSRGLDRGVGVRPAQLGYNWSRLTVSNTSNADTPSFLIGVVNREAPDKTGIALSPIGAFPEVPISYESTAADDTEAAVLLIGRVSPHRTVRLRYGQRIQPDDVLFPEQTRTGPDDDRVAFGEPLIFSALVAHHLSFERAADLVLRALRATSSDVLADYLAAVDASDPGGVERSVGLALRIAPEYTADTRLFFGGVIARLGDLLPPPAGVDLAAGGFEDALDGLAGQHLLDIHRAHEVDIEAAPASVRQLLVDEFEALGGYDAAGAVGRGGPFGSAASCSRVGTVGGDGPAADIGAGAFATPHLSALAQALQAARGSGERATVLHESLHAAQQTCKTDAEALANDIEAAIGGGDNRLGAQGTRTCTPPPPPPGGPSGGGGGSCGGPAAPADPNDKTVDTPQHRCRVGTILVDGEEVSRCVRYFVPVADARDPILYSIDFENLPLATANAEFVTITDELDPNLDPATLEVLATSSDSTFSVEIAGQTVTFRFVGIDLPPNVDDPEGTGFVTFGVRPRAGLGAGTEIRNEASIVFDFNPPIETPAVIHEIRETADLATALVVPEESSNPAIPFAAVVVNENGDVATEAVVTLSADAPITSASPSSGTCSGVGTGLVTCEVGDLTIGAAVVVTLVLDGSVRGVYTVTSSVASNAFDAFASNDSDTQQVGVLDVGTESPDGAIPREVVLAGARPNPVQAAAVLRWGVPTATAVDLRVYDLRGREVAVLVEGESVIAGWHETTWRPSLATGVYLVRLRAGGEVQTRKLVIVR